ncbi:MAG: ABC transporter substrate-binding protein [Tissierellia bacterium]|nr:ABC transporter substrate-binding protein [Tissierellia bacterium]
MNSRVLCFLLILLLVLSLIVGCASNGKVDIAADDKVEDIEIEEEEVPSLRIVYTFSNYHAPLIVAAAKNNAFENEGIYLEEIIEGEKYALISDGEKVSNIELVAVRDGKDVMDMLAQGNGELGFSSMEFPLKTIDDGYDIKILGPIGMDGMALVMGQDMPIDDLDSFMQYIREHDEPLSIGYHAPSTMPIILFEAAMKERAISFTRNPGQKDNDILLVDLKGTANLIPSLQAEQVVDGWIGFSPFPELAELEGAGKVILDLDGFNPMGRWNEFPHSVISARDGAIENHYKEIGEFFKLLSIAMKYMNQNEQEVGGLVADWIGTSADAIASSNISYSMKASQNWIDNADVVFRYLQDSGKFKGKLANGQLGNMRDDIFYFTFALNSQ